MQKGETVTRQPRAWRNGAPIKGWPDPQFAGTITRVINSPGVPCVRVKWASGRLETWPICRLTLVEASQ